MIFSDIYKGPRNQLSKLRHNSHAKPAPIAVSDGGGRGDYDLDRYPDLLSRDKTKQKEAVKRYLADKVRSDWEFSWPVQNNGGVAHVDIERPKAIRQPALLHTRAASDGADEIATKNPKQESGDGQHEETLDDVHAGSGYEVDEESDSDMQSVYSTVSEDDSNFRPRAEWTSDLSDEEPSPESPFSPFRFDSPDAVGTTIQAKALLKRAERRRLVRKEMQWNQGLACFEARRNAWTGAKIVRVRSKPASPGMSPLSPLSPRRLFFRSSISGPPTPGTPSSPATAAAPSSSTHHHHRRPSPDTTASTRQSDSSDSANNSTSLTAATELSRHRSKNSSASDTQPSPASQNYPVETLLPVPRPLLPPQNPMRASITPAVYLSIYDKVIIHSLTPSCPVNLADVVRACVSGWKRDGEWPPRSSAQPAPVAKSGGGGEASSKRRKSSAIEHGNGGGGGGAPRRMSFGGFLNRDKHLERGEKEREDDGPGKVRKSLQRVFGGK